MGEIATTGQLRMSFVRWALVTVPAILLAGILASQLANSGFDNPWFARLDLPPIMPPGWVFGVAWPILYTLMGLALALVLSARGARGRALAVGLFVVQLVANYAWSPLFFGAHQVTAAYWLIVTVLVLAIATTFAFGRIRGLAAWLMLPYLVWLSFAAILNYQIDARNPDAEALAPEAARIQIGGTGDR